MPDIYDPDRGLIISLTDDDYEDYQDGRLSEDFYARRTDGSIANRVDISRLDDDSDDGEPSDGIDVGSAAIGALIVAAVGGAVYGIKKLWDWGKKKRLEKKAEEAQHHQETGTQIREDNHRHGRDCGRKEKGHRGSGNTQQCRDN